MDNKYIIQVPGDDYVAQWSEEKYNANKDALMKKYPDAIVTSMRQYSADDEIGDNDNFIIQVPGDDYVAQWDVKKFGENREKLMQAYPDAQISVAKPVDYWGPKLQEQQAALDAFNETEDAAFKKEYEDAMSRSTAFEKERARTRSTEKNPDIDYLDTNRERYQSVNRGYKELQKDYYSNPLIRGYYDEKSVISSNANKDYASKAENTGDREERKNFERAAKLQNDITKLYSQPIKQTEDDDLRTFLKDYSKGMGTTFTDKDFWTRGFSAIARNLDLRGIQKKLNDGIAALNHEPTDEDIDRILSPGEKALLNSFRDLSMAQFERAEDLPMAYTAGQGAAESLGFMAEFLLSGAVTKAAGSALSKSSNAVAKWLGREMQVSVLDASEKGAKLMAARTAGMSKGREFAYKYITKPVGEAVSHTILQPMTYRSISDNLTRVDDEGQLIGAGKAILTGAFDSLIENWSESMGGAVEGVIAAPFKLAGKGLNKAVGGVRIGEASISDLARYFGDNRFTQFLKQTGFNGFIGEMGEEWLGNAARVATGLMSKEEFKKFASLDSQLEMAASFGLMTGISAIGNTRQMALTAREYGRLSEKIKNRLAENGVSQQGIDDVFNRRYATSKDIAKAFMPYYDKLVQNGTEEDVRDVYNMLHLMGQLSVIKEYNNEQTEIRRNNQIADLNKRMNDQQWWLDTDDGQKVKRYIDNNGVEGFVIGQTEDGRDIVNFIDGRKRFIGDEQRQNENLQMFEPVAVNDYLDAQDELDKSQKEQVRMAAETEQQTQDVRAAAQPGSQINVGTIESPRIGVVQQTSDNGAVVQFEDGSFIEIPWDKVADYVGKPIDVKTDTKIEEEALESERIIEDTRKKADSAAKAGASIVKDGAQYSIMAVPSSVPTEDGIMFNAWAVDEVGRSVNLQLTGDEVSQLTSQTQAENEQPVDNIQQEQAGGAPEVENEQQPDAGQPAAVPADDGVLRDFRGKIIPLKEDGKVNQNALWNDSPEAWARWKTSELGDGGVYAVDYIGKAVKKLEEAAREKQKVLSKETDFDKLEQVEGEIAGLNGRIGELNTLSETIQQEAAAKQAEAKRIADEQEALRKQEELDVRDAQSVPMQEIRQTLNDNVDNMGFEAQVRLAAANSKYIWNDNPNGTKGLGSHVVATGGSKESERRKHISWIASKEKGGAYPEMVAHNIFQNLPENIKEGHDEMEALDIVLNTVMSAGSQYQALRQIYDEVGDMERTIRNQEREYIANQQHSFAVERGFESYDDYVVFQEEYATFANVMNSLEEPMNEKTLDEYYNYIYGTEEEGRTGQELSGMVQATAEQAAGNEGGSGLGNQQGPGIEAGSSGSAEQGQGAGSTAGDARDADVVAGESQRPTETTVESAEDSDTASNQQEKSADVELNGQLYNIADLEQQFRDDIEMMLNDDDIDAEIVGVKLIGSRIEGSPRTDSDLDLLVEYKGDIAEDALFNILNTDGFEINGVKLDINPIKEGKSGTIEQFLKRNEGYTKNAPATDEAQEYEDYLQEDEQQSEKPKKGKKSGGKAKARTPEPKKTETTEQPIVPAGTVLKNNIAGADAVVKIVGMDKKTREYLVDYYQNMYDVEHNISMGDQMLAEDELKRRINNGEFTEVSKLKSEEAKQPEKTDTYGASNTLVTQDRYEELKRKLRGKLNNLNAGFDPETFAIGCEMAAYHMEAGARSFVDFCKRMITDLGDAVRPYLKSFYNGARDLPGMEELSKLMDAYDVVSSTDVDAISIEEPEPPTAPTGTDGTDNTEDAVVSELSGEQNERSTGAIGTVVNDRNTRTGEDIWVVKPSQRVGNDVFKSLRDAAKSNNGYWSTFKHGFLFKSEEDANNFNNSKIEGYEKTDEQKPASTAALVSEAGVIAEEADAVAKDERATEEQLQHQVDKIDAQLEKISDKLALLGGYKADEDVPFNEMYGYMKSAEKKAVADMRRLAKSLCIDLGLEPKSGKVGANIAPIGGDVSMRIPLLEGKELYLTMYVEKARTEGDLSGIQIMWRIEEPSASGPNRYGSNMLEVMDVPYRKLVDNIRYSARKYLPEQTTDIAEQAREISKKNKEKKKNELPLFGDDMFGDLFADVQNAEIQPTNNNDNVDQRTEEAGNRPGEETGVQKVGSDGAAADGGVQAEDAGVVPEVGRTGADSTEDTGEADADGRVSTEGRVLQPLGDTGHPAQRASGGVRVQPAVNEQGSVESPKKEGDKRTDDGSRRTAKEKAAPLNTRNFLYPKDTESLDSMTPGQRFEANISAMETLATLIREERDATPEERVILSRLRGWGGVDIPGKYAINNRTNSWGLTPLQKRFVAAIKELDPEDKLGVYDAISTASLTAYYTPLSIASAINSGVEAFGYKGGGIMLDPSTGNGIFEGTMSKAVQQSTQIHGCELDWLTGQIARRLYPDADIRINGFEASDIPANYFDVVESNIPFGAIRVTDKSWIGRSTPVRNAASKMIHNYFAVKMIESTKPGGLCVIMTSKATMDTAGNAIIRKYITDECELLGAVRLPHEVFKGAGTMPVTDVLFLRKFRNDEDRSTTQNDEDYRKNVMDPFNDSAVAKLKDEDGEEHEIRYNAYYELNSGNVLGQPMAGGQYKKDSFDVTSGSTNEEIAEQIEKLCREFAKKHKARSGNDALAKVTPSSVAVQAIRESYVGNGDFVGAGNIVIQNGKIGVLRPDVSDKYSKGYVFEEMPSISDKARVTAFTALRTDMKRLIAAQIEGKDSDAIDSIRKSMQGHYNSFVQKYGRLNDRKNDFVKSDIDGYQLCGLEVYEDGKFVGMADIFTKNTINSKRDIYKVSGAKEAVQTSLSEYGGVNTDYLEKVLGENWEQQCEGLLYKDPAHEGEYISAEAYLSGDVVSKLADARRMAANDSSYEENVKALEEVQPKRKEYGEFPLHMGAQWVPASMYTDFLTETFGITNRSRRYGSEAKSGVVFVEESCEFFVNIDSAELGGAASSWETSKVGAARIFEAALKDSDITVYFPHDKDEKPVVDQEATESARAKTAELRERFEDWVPESPERVLTLTDIYNDRFNRTRLIDWNGQHLEVPGLQGKTLRPHQKDAVWMLLNNKGGIVDHIVGAGKTLVMQSAIMEMRRMGIARKPMIVALKSTCQQIAKEFREAFPQARVLVPGDGDFNSANRKKFIANITMNDYDCVILSHEQYCMLDHSEQVKQQVVNEQLTQLNALLEYLYGTNDQSQLTKKQIKGLQKRIENLKAKLEALNAKKTDSEFTFENLGVDMLFVDECQAFKNLTYSTSYSRIAGLGPQEGSSRSLALLHGIRYLQGMRHGDMGTVFLSGTTITNSLSELYNIFNYLRPNEMARMGMRTFDSWASTFAVRSTEAEFGVTNELKEKVRFRKFEGLQELARIYKEIADVRNDSNLELPKPKMNVHLVTIPITDTMAEINRAIVEMVNTKKGDYFGVQKIERNGRDMTPWSLIATNLAKLATLSPKLIDTKYDDEGGKVQYCCENIKKIYDQFKEQKGTQLVFCDGGVPGPGKPYDVYTDIINRLVNTYGIPRSEIADIHTADTEEKRKALFQKVNDGTVRVLIGGTKNMGTGVNVQKRIVAMHHMDIPWTPSDVEQRNGRGSRQGNEVARGFNGNKVEVFYYAVERTLDTYRYQLQDTKGKMINAFKTASATMNEFDEGSDEGSESGSAMNPAEMVALLSGNPVILEKSKQDRLVDKLRKQRRGWERDMASRRNDRRYIESQIKAFKGLIASNERDMDLLRSNGFKPDDNGEFPPMKTSIHDNMALYAGDAEYTKAKELGAAIRDQLRKGKQISLRSYGMTGEFVRDESLKTHIYLRMPSGIDYHTIMSDDDTALGMAMHGLLKKVFSNSEAYKKSLKDNEDRLASMPEVEAEWPKQAELEAAVEKKAAIDAEYDALVVKDEKSVENSSESSSVNEPDAIYGNTYICSDGEKVRYKSLLSDSDSEEAGTDAVPEQAGGSGEALPATGPDNVQRGGIPGTVTLRRLELGEFCSVERQYTENKHYSFTSRKNKIESYDDVAYIFKSLQDSAVENAFVVLVKKGKPTIIHLSIGGFAEADFDNRLLIPAVNDIKPEKMFMVHNHPSGSLRASMADVSKLEEMNKAFGGIVEGIIIDTFSGKYGVFGNGTNSTRENVESLGKDRKLKVYSFDKQSYISGTPTVKLANATEVAEFISTQRLGLREKLCALIVSQAAEVTGNIHLPFDTIKGNEKEIAEYLSDMAVRMGGVGAILYGNNIETGDTGAINRRMREFGMRLVDALNIKSRIKGFPYADFDSAALTGLLEPNIFYRRNVELDSEASGNAEAMVSGEEETLSADTKAKQWVVDELMSMLGDDVQIVSQEDAEKEAYGTSAERMAKEKMLENLSKASRFVSESLYGKRQGTSFTIELPASTRRMIKRVMGTDFDSHSITANSIVHSKNNHGENGKKNTSKSIPLRDEDFSLAPYIMTAPTRIEKGSMDASGRNSIRFVYELSNGYVVVVEKEQKNSPDDMETITMWAEMSDGVADARNTSPAIDVQNVISNIDAAKIRKDAENAIENDSKSEKAELMVAYHGTGADFKRFDLSYVGEGEGAQAHGYGAYFALDKETAEGYAKKLVTRDVVYNGLESYSSVIQQAEYVINTQYKGNVAKAIKGEKLSHAFLPTPTSEFIMNSDESDWEVKSGPRILYTVDIPKDNGDNYLTEGVTIPKQNRKRIADVVRSLSDDELLRSKHGPNWMPNGLDSVANGIENNQLDAADVRWILVDAFGTEKRASEIMSMAGFVGVKYEGRKDGPCAVIFRDGDVEIVDKTEFSRDSKTVYGYAKNGKIYLTKEGINPNTPIHEYTHLWAKAMQKYNPEGWRDIVRLLKDTPVWNDVVGDESYRNLKNDDAIASEVLSRISGKKNAEKMIAEAEKAIAEADDILEKAKAISLRERMKRALDKFWNWVGTNLFGMRFDSIDEVTDRVLWDLVNGTELGDTASNESEFSIRTKPAPKKTGIGYKVFYRGKDGKLYPPMVANQGGVDTPVGVWLDAEEGTKAPDSKTGRPQVKQGGKGTQGGSGTLAYRPGWHLGKIPYALQFNRKDKDGNKTLFPKDFVWAEVEYAMDKNYQEEAMQEGMTASGKFQHSLAGLKRLPEDGYYEYRTNPNPATDPWIITGAMKVNKVLTKDEVDELVRQAGREPQMVEGDEVRDRSGYPVKNDGESNYDFTKRCAEHLNAIFPKGITAKAVGIDMSAKEMMRCIGVDDNTENRKYYYDFIQKAKKEHKSILGVSYKAFNANPSIVVMTDNVHTFYKAAETYLHENMHNFFSLRRNQYIRTGSNTFDKLIKEWYDRLCEDIKYQYGIDVLNKKLYAIRRYKDNEKPEEFIIRHITEQMANFTDDGLAWEGTYFGNFINDFKESIGYDRERYGEGELGQRTGRLYRGREDSDLRGGLVSKTKQAQQVADKLGVKVEFVSREQMPDGHKWSMGVWQNGRILVCPANNPNADEAAKTVLHEAVGHEGLRKLLGREYVESFCMELYRQLPESRKEIIDHAMKRHNWNMAVAVEEWIAGKAQDFNMDEEFHDTFFDKVRTVLRNILSKLGINIPLSERDIRWLLYQNYYALHHNLKTEVNRARLAHRLGLSESALKERAEAQELIRDRKIGSTFTGARLYNTEVSDVVSRLRETIVDQYDAVDRLVTAIEKATGKAAKSFEDIRLALNQQSSKGYHDMKQWEKNFWKPLQNVIEEISKVAGLGVEEIERYMMLKHGLERNEVFAKRDARNYYKNVHDIRVEAIKNDDSLDDSEKQDKIEKEDKSLQKHLDEIENGTDSQYLANRQKDYGGLTGMFCEYPGTLKPFDENAESIEEYYERVLRERRPIYDNVADTEEAAQKEVDAFEQQIGNVLVDELWARTNAATKATLKHQYDHNMMSRSQYEYVKDMFQYYIPLRGFDDKTAGDIYSYYTTPSGNQFQAPVLRAKGRVSKAGSPLGYIGAQASSGIAQDMKNDSKLALWFFVNNRPENDLVTISETWYVKETDEDGEPLTDMSGRPIFTPSYPPFNEDMSSDAAKADYETWENSMKSLRAQGLAFRGVRDMEKQHLSYVINQSKEQRNSHIITLKVGGAEKFMFIKGNPRAAQAINNELNMDVEDSFQRIFGPLNRFFSNINTSMNPEFWISNLQRDIVFGLMSVDVKENEDYRKAFHANLMKAVKAVKMNKAYNNGSLGKGYLEDMYREFVDNGGVTGYTTISDKDKWEAEVRKFADSNKSFFEKVEGKFDAVKSAKVFEAIAEMSDGIEQINRFCAFLTAREMGKDVRQAIADAKELTINFNRKGSGKPITFEEAKKLTYNGKTINPIMQLFAVAISRLNRYGRQNIIFWNASVQALNAMARMAKANPGKLTKWGVLMFGLGAINAAIHAMLDDDDDYLDIPDYERHNNLLLGGNGYYFKWALPQEMRVLYGIGDMAVTYSMGRYPHKDPIKESFKMLSAISPLDFSEGWIAVAPTWARPAVEVKANRDFKGSRIYKDNRYMSDAEKNATPNWNNAYRNTGKVYVDLSRLLNFVSGGDDVTAGRINIHPEALEHIVEGFTGGAGTTLGKAYRSTIGNAIGLLGEFGKEHGEEPSLRNVPFLSRMFTITDDRYSNSYVKDLYWYYKGMSEKVKHDIDGYIKAGELGKAVEIQNSDDFKMMLTFNSYKKRIKHYDDLLKVTTDRDERKQLTMEQDAVKAEMIKKISEISKQK